MSRGERIAFWLTLLLLAVAGAYVARNFSVTTDVSALLPADRDHETLRLVREVAESELGRTMVLTLGAPDSATALAATRAFEQALRKDARVAAQLDSLEGGPAAGTEQAIYELYHPRRLAFLTDDPSKAAGLLDESALQQAAANLKEKLGQPMSALLGRVAPSDPLQILPRLFESFERDQGGSLRVEDGRFLTRDGRYGVLFLRSRARGFDSNAQAPLLAGIRDVFATLNAAHGRALTLDQSGVNRFAVRAQETISGDLERVSTLSMIGLGLLMFSLFRSLRLLLIASIPLGAGTLVGIAACLAVYGSVHGITLAFGAALLGVTLDYVEHLYCHHAVAPHPGGPRATLRAIGPALITGAATTLVGFVALGGSGIRGLVEVALFSSCGLCAALLTSFTLLPSLLPERLREVPFRARLVERLGQAFDRLQHTGRWLWILPGAALLVVGLGLPRLRASDDATMGQLDPELVAEDARVRARVARYENMRFALAIGHDEESALQANDQLLRSLEQAVSAHEIAGFRNLGGLLPSARRQRAVEGAARAALGDGARLLRAFEGEGFRAEAFAPFSHSLTSPALPALRFEDLARSPLAGLVRPFRITLTEGVAFLTFLEHVQEPEAFAARLARVPGARFVDQQTQLKSAHTLYQKRTAQLVLLGVLGVLILLALRYRDVGRTLAAFLPSVLAAGVTLSVLALLGRPLDLVALAALLMVISMGVDYGVFLVDASESEHERTVALLSVFLAASTTVLGFGLLALSRHPLLSIIGITATVGMLACLLLAPTTLILLTRRRSET
ncbi:MAG TPA: MMPL family transporter [Polyangiales bacterium]